MLSPLTAHSCHGYSPAIRAGLAVPVGKSAIDSEHGRSLTNGTDGRGYILDAAEEIFAARGFAAAMTLDIGTRAGPGEQLPFHFLGLSFLDLIWDRDPVVPGALAERATAARDCLLFGVPADAGPRRAAP